MPAAPARRPAATLAALALLAALATGGCGADAPAPATPAAPAATAAAPPTTGAAARPGTAPAVATASGPNDADRAAQLLAAGVVLRALGDLAAGRPAPPELRPEVLEDLRRLIDGSDGVGRHCLTEFAVVGTPEWRVDPVAFVPLLGPDGALVAGSRDAGARLTTTRLEGYRTALTYQPPPATGATPVAPPPGSPCAPATPGVPVRLPDDTHRALRGEALAVLVEYRDGAWVATEAVGSGLP